MPELEGSAGRLHYVITGVGEPTTLFVPGLAQSIADTRAFGSAVDGSRIFVDLRGHGGSAAPEVASGWTYRELADDVDRVAGTVGASRAVGVSLGAAAIARLMSDEPTRFDRVVLALPGVLTASRSDAELAVTDALADAMVDGPGGNPAQMASALVQLQPESVRRRADVKIWSRRHAAEIGGRRDTAAAVREMPRQTALASLDCLSGVTARVLVLAQRDDDVHPLESAQALADALPDAEVVVSDVPWIWGGRAVLRDTISRFLNER